MWRHNFLKLKVTNFCEVLVSSDVRSSNDLPFYNVLVRQDFPFCYRERLNFQVFALRDIKMVAREAFRIDQKSNYNSRFC